MFCSTVSEENSAPSWNRMPQRCSISRRSCGDERLDVLPEQPDLAGVGLDQPGDDAHQHRLALARTADDAEDLAAIDVEAQSVQI